MTQHRHSRLMTPAIALIAGTTIACAVGIRQSWGTALGCEVIALAWAAGLYVMGGSDSDTGSVLGRRDDERQQLVGLQAARLALAVVLAAITVLCLIAAAANYAIWPFETLLVVIGVAYFVGLRVYGTDSETREPAAGYSRFGFRQEQPPA